jgi:hypothetical protein
MAERNHSNAALGSERHKAESYIHALGYSWEDAETHAERIGHAKVLAHQLAGENPLREEKKAAPAPVAAAPANPAAPAPDAT